MSSTTNYLNTQTASDFALLGQLSLDLEDVVNGAHTEDVRELVSEALGEVHQAVCDLAEVTFLPNYSIIKIEASTSSLENSCPKPAPIPTDSQKRLSAFGWW